jgi:hypothetical protein
MSAIRRAISAHLRSWRSTHRSPVRACGARFRAASLCATEREYQDYVSFLFAKQNATICQPFGFSPTLALLASRVGPAPGRLVLPLSVGVVRVVALVRPNPAGPGLSAGSYRFFDMAERSRVKSQSKWK